MIVSTIELAKLYYYCYYYLEASEELSVTSGEEGGGVGNMAVISTHQIPIVILLRYLYYELSQLKLYFFWYNYSIIKKGWNLNFQWFTYRYLCDILAISKYILIFILRIKQTI